MTWKIFQQWENNTSITVANGGLQTIAETPINANNNESNALWLNSQDIIIYSNESTTILQVPVLLVINTIDLITRHQMREGCEDMLFGPITAPYHILQTIIIILIL